MSSQNVQLRGGVNNNFVGVADTGHASTQSAFDQFTVPPQKVLPAIKNTPVSFDNIPCAYVTVQNPVENDLIRIGGLGDQTPYIDRNFKGDSRGTIVYPGTSMDFDVTNANLLTAVGTPGQYFSFHAYPNVTETVTVDNSSPVDSTTPAPVSTTPTTAATSIITNTSIFAIFNKALDPTTVNATNVTISPVVAGTVLYDSVNLKVSFSPTAVLATSTTYTVTLSNITDTNGYAMSAPYSWSFTTAIAPDTTPPTIASTSPTAGATGVAVTVAPTIVFSESMAAATINATNVLLLNASLVTVASTVTLATDKMTATITPNANLSNNVTYTIRVLVAVTDLAGNHLAAQFNRTFTTAAAIVPTVTSITPANGASNVSITGNITAVFSQQLADDTNIDNSTTIGQNNFKILDNTGTNINVDPDTFETLQLPGQTTVVVSPQTPLKNSVTYTVKITGVKSLAGVTMNTIFTSTFTTAAAAYTQVFNNSGQTNTHAQVGASFNAAQWGLYVNSSLSKMQNIVPRKIIIPLSKNGSPTGTIYLRMINDTYAFGDSRQIIQTIGSLDIATLTTTDTNYTFENATNSIKLDVLGAAGLVVEYNGGNSSNYLRVQRDGNAAYDGNNTIVVYTAGSSYTYDTSRDFAGTVYT